MEFDIRTNQAEEISVLRFADDNSDEYTANGILNNQGVIVLSDIVEGRALQICSEEHAQNLIKAINKAIELGWFGG